MPSFAARRGLARPARRRLEGQNDLASGAALERLERLVGAVDGVGAVNPHPQRSRFRQLCKEAQFLRRRCGHHIGGADPAGGENLNIGRSHEGCHMAARTNHRGEFGQCLLLVHDVDQRRDAVGMLGSVAAVTEDGTLVAASALGGQLGAYVAGAGRVILVVGSQKIVSGLDAALRRINEVVFPFETAQVRERMGVDTVLEEVLLMYGEWQTGRTTVVLVREPVGV